MPPGSTDGAFTAVRETTRRDFLIDNNGFSTTTGNTGQGLIANLTVTYDVTPRMAVYAHANNIFDSRFEPVNGYQTPGPSVWVGMRFKI